MTDYGVHTLNGKLGKGEGGVYCEGSEAIKQDKADNLSWELWAILVVLIRKWT